jgi:hypothetical protein
MTQALPMRRTAQLAKHTIKFCLVAGLAFLSWVEFKSETHQAMSSIAELLNALFKT